MSGVDWRKVRLQPGGWYCPIHGPVTPAAGVVPHCPDRVGGRPCLRIAVQAVARRGGVITVEARPTVCPSGHPLTLGSVRLGSSPCPCVAVGFHRSWTCGTCADVIEWPEHDPKVARAR